MLDIALNIEDQRDGEVTCKKALDTLVHEFEDDLESFIDALRHVEKCSLVFLSEQITYRLSLLASIFLECVAIWSLCLLADDFQLFR